MSRSRRRPAASRAPRAAAIARAALAGLLLTRVARADEPPPPSPSPSPPSPSPPAPAAPIEVSVRGRPRPRDPGRQSVTTDEGRRVPGTGGDALRAVESMPGVGRASFDGGRLVIWGAAAGDTRILVDGVEIPTLHHAGGLRTVVQADGIRSLELTPGAFDAAYGRGLGGLVRLRTAELPAEGVHGVASADLLDSSVLARAGLLDGTLRVSAGARVGYLDRTASGLVSAESGDYVPLPRYRDYQGKASLALREDESLDLVLLGSSDVTERTVDAASVTRARSETASSAFQRVYLRYARAYLDGDSVEVTPFFGRDCASRDAAFGLVAAGESQLSWRYGIRAAYRARVTPDVTASIGLDALGSTSSLTRAGSLTVPPREGDIRVFGQPPGADVATDAWTTTILDVAPYVASELALGPVTLTPGLRLDAFLIEGSRVTPRAGDTPVVGFSRFSPVVEPRLAASFFVTDRLTVSAAAGLHHQAPEPADLSAVFGTPELGLSRAVHVTAGEALRLWEGLGLETAVFYRRMDHLVVRSRLPTPLLARALTQDGEGRAYGVQTLLRRERRRGVFGWISHTASRSERRYVGDAAYRVFDEDRSHVLAVVVGVERGGWGAGVRYRFTTGLPRTPVVGSFHETTSGQYQPIFGAQNSERLPDFHQLDVRVERTLATSPVRVSVYLDVLNVTYHRNVEEVVYSSDYARRGAITGLPTLAVLGARAEL